MQMNIPATFGPICFSGSLEEDWNVYGRTTDKCLYSKLVHLARWSVLLPDNRIRNKLEAQHWAEPVSLTLHSALKKLNTEHSIAYRCFPQASTLTFLIWLNENAVYTWFLLDHFGSPKVIFVWKNYLSTVWETILPSLGVRRPSVNISIFF